MNTLDLTDTPVASSPLSDPRSYASIPFEMATLPNGLTLIVHEDRRQPLIATQLRFNVGAKDEPAGRTGFAHLFEHLMFKESANRQGSWHQMVEAMGGVGVNGMTNFDWTKYFQIVPTAALDRLLWMESDRMGHLIAGIDAKTLADEVSVVKNEKRQREGAPYGGVYEAITKAIYPREHPYGHTTIGSFEDLDNVSLETAAEWHRQWYGASNAILTLAGDISFEEALEKVQHWFGGLSAGVPVQRPTRWLPEISDGRHVTLFDRIPYRVNISVWIAPPADSADTMRLKILAHIMSGGANSRLVQRLVEKDRLCLGIEASQDQRYLGGQFHISATLAPGVDPAHVDAVILEELDKLIAEGPMQEEIDRFCKVARKNIMHMQDDLSQIVDTLSHNMMMFGRPDGHLKHVEIAEEATPETIRDAARRWLSRRALRLDIRPFEPVAPSVDLARRTAVPPVGRTPVPRRPVIERTILSNGLHVWLARRPDTYGLNIALTLEGGSELDPIGAEGLSSVSLGALDAGTARRSKFDLAHIFAETGLGYSASAGRGRTTLTMGGLKSQLGQTVALLAEIFLEPAFPQEELDFVLSMQIAAAERRGLAPADAANMAMGRLVFGARHAFARPSQGDVASLRALTRERIMARHQAWLDPHRAVLLAVGDVTLDELTDVAESAFGGWTPSGIPLAPPQSILAPSPGRYAIARAGGSQSVLNAGFASPELRIGNEALTIFNLLVGGGFGSRLNANLRERRGWTYGASSSLNIAPSIGSFSIRTEVQADRTLDALNEIELELRALNYDRPISGEELENARNAVLVSLPGRWAGDGSVMAAMMEQLVYDLSDEFHDEMETRVHAVGLDDIEAVSALLGDPEKYSWVVAGDPVHVRNAGLVAIDEYARRL